MIGVKRTRYKAFSDFPTVDDFKKLDVDEQLEIKKEFRAFA